MVISARTRSKSIPGIGFLTGYESDLGAKQTMSDGGGTASPSPFEFRCQWANRVFIARVASPAEDRSLQAIYACEDSLRIAELTVN
jgi:hypothetical protein